MVYQNAFLAKIVRRILRVILFFFVWFFLLCYVMVVSWTRGPRLLSQVSSDSIHIIRSIFMFAQFNIECECFGSFVVSFFLLDKHDTIAANCSLAISGVC